MRQKNSFRFKQFTVQQADAAFKVGTDGCLLAAWIGSLGMAPKTILDVGTGSGVMALMCAQNFTEARITAIEQDEQSAEQAAQNFRASPWSERITARHTSLQSFAADTEQTFDLILCNPPFFSNSTASANERKNNARHEGKLTVETLLECGKNLLSLNGCLTFILPMERRNAVESLLADHGWIERSLTFLRPKPEKEIHRFMTCISMQGVKGHSDEWSIHDGKHQYSAKAVGLLHPFYLYL